MTTKMLYSAISPAKADRLYWLGRYAERVCTALHILRKYYDDIIDNEDSTTHVEFCTKMGIACDYANARDFVRKYLYDVNSSVSVINMLERVKDNAILLREELKSETLQYIEMAINYMKECERQDRKLYELQYITDVMYAFWGAMEGRICNVKVRDLINTGKHIERLDLYLRFDYSYEKVDDIMSRLERMEEYDDSYCDSVSMAMLRDEISRRVADTAQMLSVVNGMFAA